MSYNLDSNRTLTVVPEHVRIVRLLYPRVSIIQEETEDERAIQVSIVPQIIEPEETIPEDKTKRKQVPDNEPPPRGHWDNQWEFLLSCISMSIGLGNIWRFPVTVYRNGGGAFLIPYLLVLICVGRPIYFLELCLGQFTSRNQVQIWRCAPFFKGLGMATMISGFGVLTYYSAILALPIYYFVLSFQNPLPWTECDVSWAGFGNCNGTELNPGVNKSMTELFFKNFVLKEYDDISDGIGSPDWRLSLCLVSGWMVIYVTICKGVKVSGKVAWFTALFPNFVLLALLIRGVTLDHSLDGIRYFIEPQWDKLYDIKVWYRATTQCFFSLSTGLGPIVLFASYNPLKYDIYRASLILAVADTLTSLLAGVATFAILGKLSFDLDVEIDKVVGDGDMSLAFVAFADAIRGWSWAPQVMSALFFFMLFTIGLGSVSAMAFAMSSIFTDRYHEFREWMVILVICILGCAVGLVYVTPGGQAIVSLVDFFAGGFLVYIMSTLEVIAIAWCYGLYNFVGDVEFMIGRKLGIFWKLCWGCIIPVFLVFTFIYMFFEENLKYNGQEYPASAKVGGWAIGLTGIGCVIGAAVHATSQAEGSSWSEKLKKSLSPTRGWGPRDYKIREEWRTFKTQKNIKPLKQRVTEMFSRR